jgi:titin
MGRFAVVSAGVTASAALLIACTDQPVEPLLPGVGAAAAVSTALAAPGNAVATGRAETQIDVSWVDKSSGETGFQVYRSTTGPGGTFALLGSVGANVALYSDLNVPLGTTFCYQVRAVRVSGTRTAASAFSNTACAVTLPAAPTDANAVGSPWPRVDLSWHDNSGIETGFVILRSTDGENGTFATLAWTNANAVSASDIWVVAGSRYCYRVEAVREYVTVEGNSPSRAIVYSTPSNTTCATPPLPTEPPPSAYVVSAKPAGSAAVMLTVKWTDGSMPPPAFRAYRSTDGGAAWSLVTLTGGDNGEYSDVPVASEQHVCYHVIAYNAAGDAAPSNQACTTPPAAPTNLMVTILDASTIELTWTDNSAVEDGYEVWARWYRGSFYCYPPGSQFHDAGTYEGEGPIAELGPNATSFRAAGYYGDSCDPPTEYWFWVVAKKDGGSSNGSNTVSADGSVSLP